MKLREYDDKLVRIHCIDGKYMKDYVVTIVMIIIIMNMIEMRKEFNY